MKIEITLLFSTHTNKINVVNPNFAIKNLKYVSNFFGISWIFMVRVVKKKILTPCF